MDAHAVLTQGATESSVLGLGDAGDTASERLVQLREALLGAPYALCTQKAALLTDFFAREVGAHPLTRLMAPVHFALVRRALPQAMSEGRPQSPGQIAVSNRLMRLYARFEQSVAREPLIVTYARALAHILREKTLRIYDHELIVGNLTSQRIGAAIHPDYGGLLLLPELRTLAQRPVNPLHTTPEQIEQLEREVFPYWFSRSVMTRAPVLAHDPGLQNTLMRGRSFILTQIAGISHVTPDYQSVLEKGFRGILADVERARSAATSREQQAFFEAAAISARAAIDFGRRWSAHCAAAATNESDPVRAGELQEIAQILQRTPAEPARTFHEALQSLFLAHVIVHQESFQHGVSFGRLDQYLLPYYESDVREGRLTRKRAVELLGCFLGKAAEQLPLFNAMATEYFSGLSSASGITLGGTDADGNDATNDLTSLIIVAYDQMRLRQPNLHLRVHDGTPPELLTLAHETLKKGGGMPALFNDAAIVPALGDAGASTDDARDYAVVGCVEWGVPRKSFPAAGAGFVSLPAVLDDVLHGADIETLASSDDVVAAFQRRLERVIADAVDGSDAIEEAHARFRPTPFLSLLVQGCIDSGRDVTAGGALYNSTGLQGVGLADVADSLAAIERVVFQDKTVSLRELVEALDADFAGFDLLRHRLLNKAAKYGEDDGPPEEFAQGVATVHTVAVRRHGNPRGGSYLPGFWSMTTHVGFGKRTGALPSGRLRGQPFADGISPVNGCDRGGPTASLMAAARLAGLPVANGLALNEKLDPCFVAGASGTEIMNGLTRGYFGAGGLQVQYNILDREVLLDAKQHPERHRGLVVRISGYSAYFNDLTEAMKDDVIARTQHGFQTSGPACQAGPGPSRA